MSDLRTTDPGVLARECDRYAAHLTSRNAMLDAADLFARCAIALRCAPEPPAQQDRNGVWLVVYSDIDLQPVLFAGTGADEAARRFYQDAKTQWTVRLFQCVAQSGFGPPLTKAGSES